MCTLYKTYLTSSIKPIRLANPPNSKKELVFLLPEPRFCRQCELNTIWREEKKNLWRHTHSGRPFDSETRISRRNESLIIFIFIYPNQTKTNTLKSDFQFWFCGERVVPSPRYHKIKQQQNKTRRAKRERDTHTHTRIHRKRENGRERESGTRCKNWWSICFLLSPRLLLVVWSPSPWSLDEYNSIYDIRYYFFIYLFLSAVFFIIYMLLLLLFDFWILSRHYI